MKINGLIDNPLWYDIPCRCDHDSIETEYPIADCLHCKFEEQEKSLPKENFRITENRKNQTTTRTVKEITIVRGSTYQDIIGWTF